MGSILSKIFIIDFFLITKPLSGCILRPGYSNLAADILPDKEAENQLMFYFQYTNVCGQLICVTYV